MPVIGTFTATKNGGWAGTIRTLTIHIRARFVPNDNRESERSPDFRIMAGTSELGAAWVKHTRDSKAIEYLSVQIDDPSLEQPLSAAMFLRNGSDEAQLVWSRLPDKRQIVEAGGCRVEDAGAVQKATGEPTPLSTG